MMSPLDSLGMSLFNSIFNDFPMGAMQPVGTIHGVKVNDLENGKEFVYTLPGIPPTSLDVNVEGNDLTVEILAKDEHRMENVKSRVSLPDGADVENIEAHCENGILRVVVPFVETEKRAIKVSFPDSGKVLESSK